MRHHPFFLDLAEWKDVMPQEIGHDQQNRPGKQEVTIRLFVEQDAPQVRELFITVNRLLGPPDLRDAFEAYIERALTEESTVSRPITASGMAAFGLPSGATKWSAHSA